MASSGFPYFLFLVPLAAWLARAVNSRSDWHDRNRGKLESSLDDAENLILGGNLEEAEGQLAVAAPLLDTVKDSAARGFTARLHLCEGAIAKARDQWPEARTSFGNVLLTLDAIEDRRLAANLRARAEAENARFTDDGDEFRTRSERALSLEPEADDPLALARMAWVAVHLGRYEQATGRWERARRLWEEAIRIAERIPTRDHSAQTGWAREKEIGTWADARAGGARAATELAETLHSVGERDSAETWYERAEQLLRGPEHGIALEAAAAVRLSRAQSSQHGLTGAVDSGAWLESAAQAGAASGTPGGSWLAARAECLIGQERLRAGDAEQAIPRLQAALERVRELDEPSPRLMTIQLLTLLGDARFTVESWEPAAADLRQALERAEKAIESECRDLAVEIMDKLHTVLLQRGALEEARELLERFGKILPGLSPGARRFGAIVHSQRLGLQMVEEANLTGADEAFARAEALARENEATGAPYWERHAALQRGMLGLRLERPTEAREHLLRALALSVTTLSPGEESSERAALHLRLAECEMALDRDEVAERLLRQAGEDGVASGRPFGRYLAALASWIRAGQPERELEERRRLLDAASRLGRLSGTESGRLLAGKAEGAIKELGL